MCQTNHPNTYEDILPRNWWYISNRIQMLACSSLAINRLSSSSSGQFDRGKALHEVSFKGCNESMAFAWRSLFWRLIGEMVQGRTYDWGRDACMTCQIAGFMFQRWLCLILKLSIYLKESRKSCKTSSLEIGIHSHTQEMRRGWTKSSKIEELNPK